MQLSNNVRIIVTVFLMDSTLVSVAPLVQGKCLEVSEHTLHLKTYLITCAVSEGLDLDMYLPLLLGVFHVHMQRLWTLGLPLLVSSYAKHTQRLLHNFTDRITPKTCFLAAELRYYIKRPFHSDFYQTLRMIRLHLEWQII